MSEGLVPGPSRCHEEKSEVFAHLRFKRAGERAAQEDELLFERHEEEHTGVALQLRVDN
jgi:hypothetical protein